MNEKKIQVVIYVEVLELFTKNLNISGISHFKHITYHMFGAFHFLKHPVYCQTILKYGLSGSQSVLDETKSRNITGQTKSSTGALVRHLVYICLSAVKIFSYKTFNTKKNEYVR